MAIWLTTIAVCGCGAAALKAALEAWQRSVVQSLNGKDY
jgi:hypothetical protein